MATRYILSGRYHVLAALLLLAIWSSTSLAATCDSYGPVIENRTAAQTFSDVEAQPGVQNSYQAAFRFEEFQRQILLNQNLTFAQLVAAERAGRVTIGECGNCNLVTACILRNDSWYHRKVEPTERVLYVDGEAVLLPKCINPVKPGPRKPEVVFRPGCVGGDTAVRYSSGSWINPGSSGPYGYGSYGYGWANSHHNMGMNCTWKGGEQK